MPEAIAMQVPKELPNLFRVGIVGKQLIFLDEHAVVMHSYITETIADLCSGISVVPI